MIWGKPLRVIRVKKKRRERKNGLKSPKKHLNGPVEKKAPFLKYTNYHFLTAPVDHIYAITDKNLYRQPDAMKRNRSRRYVKKNCSFHNDIGHSTERCVALKDEIERLIRAGHLKKFLDKPQAANREERPQQWSPKRIRELLTIIGGPHVAKKSHSTCDR